MPESIEHEISRPVQDGQSQDGRPLRGEAPKPSFAARVRAHPVKLLLGLLILAGLAAGAVFLLRYLESYESTDDAQVDGPMTMMSPRIPGTITAVYVQENQFVQQGQILAEIDPRDYRVALERAQADLAQSQAQVRAENPNVSITQTSTETTISSAQGDIVNAEAGVGAAERDYAADLAKVRDAEANHAKARADLERYKPLLAKDEVSRQEYDQKVAAAESAAANLESAREAAAASQKVIEQRRAVLAQAQSRLAQARRNAPRQLDIQRANVQSRQASTLAAKAAVEQAKLNLEYAKIVAPVNGIVGRKSVEVGMRVQPGQQLLAIVRLDDLWVTANFKETQLRRMRPGQRATIHVDAFGRDYDGYVESLPAATGAKYSILPPENATGNYVKVVQRLPVRLRFKPGQDPEHRLRPGMSVEPKVWLE